MTRETPFHHSAAAGAVAYSQSAVRRAVHAVGGSKIGKSWLCLWLCLQLAKGGEFWGRPLRAQAVLYLCLEDTYARIQNRLFRLSEEEMPDNLYFQTACEGWAMASRNRSSSFWPSALTPGW